MAAWLRNYDDYRGRYLPNCGVTEKDCGESDLSENLNRPKCEQIK